MGENVFVLRLRKSLVENKQIGCGQDIGSSNIWFEKVLDVSGYNGSKIRIRFKRDVRIWNIRS